MYVKNYPHSCPAERQFMVKFYTLSSCCIKVGDCLAQKDWRLSWDSSGRASQAEWNLLELRVSSSYHAPKQCELSVPSAFRVSDQPAQAQLRIVWLNRERPVPVSFTSPKQLRWRCIYGYRFPGWTLFIAVIFYGLPAMSVKE